MNMSHDAAAMSVTRAEGEFGAWEMAWRGPHRALASDIVSYTGVRSRLAISAELHLPCGEAVLAINLGEPHRIVGEDACELVFGHASAALMGVHRRPFVTHSDGRKQLMLVRLRPGAAHRLFGGSMADHTDRWVDLSDIDRPFAQTLTAAAMGQDDWVGRFRAVEDLIGARLSEKAPGPSITDWAWEQMRLAGGQIGVSRLADATGHSHRRLIACFRAELGVTPKTAARLLRFNRVLRGMRKLKAAAGAALAHDCGYADQAHMISEFRSFAGATPTEIARRAVGYSLRA